MIDVTGEFVIFYTAYTLILIFIGQIAGLLIRQQRIGSIIGQMFVYIVVLFLLLLASVVTNIDTIVNSTGA